MDIRIIIATHKKYWMPEDPMYYPIHVGRAGKMDIGFPGDDTGEHISEKNANYCELTGLYWAWKNLKADYLGVAHYRRHFSAKPRKNRFASVLVQSEAEKLLESCDVLLPTPRNYYIETNYSQYVHAHHAVDLDKTREILCEKFPEYINAYDRSMKSTKGHRFNMFIMQRDKADAYCSWLFSVLFELERRLDISEYSSNDARVFGFVSERLLDVWLETNRIEYREIPYIFMEKENWFRKGTAFLKRKFSR